MKKILLSLLLIMALFSLFFLLVVSRNRSIIDKICLATPPFKVVCVDGEGGRICRKEFSYFRESCISAFTMAFRDPNLCRYAYGGEDPCVVTFASKVKDPTVCSKLEGELKKDYLTCFYESVRSNSEKDWCLKLIDDYEKKICYLHLAEAKKDAGLCFKDDNFERVEPCIVKVAFLRNDLEVCNLTARLSKDFTTSEMEVKFCKDQVKMLQRNQK